MENADDTWQKLEERLEEAGYGAWPSQLKDPPFSGTPTSVSLDDGIYLSRWPGGGLRLLVRVVKGRVGPWIRIDEDGMSGTALNGVFGEKYYANNTVESFSPWDDTSEPEKVGFSLGRWALKTANNDGILPPLQRRTESPMISPAPRRTRLVETPPLAHLPVSGQGDVPTEAVSAVLQSYRGSSPRGRTGHL